MKSLFNIENNKFKFIFSILFFGGLWGIIESTLGSILHLPMFDNVGIYLASTTIMLPIAYGLMAKCYKDNSYSFLSVIFMGLIAGMIKLSTSLFLGFTKSVYNPAIFIILESLIMSLSLLVVRPSNVFSLKTLLCIGISNTIFMFAFLGIKALQGSVSVNAFASLENWQNIGEKYLLKTNLLVIIYSFVIGTISLGITKLCNKLNIKFDSSKLNRVIYSPLVAIGVVILSFTLNTIL